MEHASFRAPSVAAPVFQRAAAQVGKFVQRQLAPPAYSIRAGANIDPDAHTKGVDTRLAKIVREAAEKFVAANPGYRVEAFSGRKGRESGTKNHPTGRAIDVKIFDPSGKELPNSPARAKVLGVPFGPAFRIYEQYAQAARQVQLAKYPELTSKLRYGGYFKQGVSFDAMHLDISGGNTAYGNWDTGLNEKGRAALPGAESVGLSGASGATEASLGNSRITKNSSPERIAALQTSLAQAGFDPGDADGKFGPRTRAAVEAFQRATGLTTDGKPGLQTLGKLAGLASAGRQKDDYLGPPLSERTLGNPYGLRPPETTGPPFTGNMPRPRPMDTGADPWAAIGSIAPSISDLTRAARAGIAPTVAPTIARPSMAGNVSTGLSASDTTGGVMVPTQMTKPQLRAAGNVSPDASASATTNRAIAPNPQLSAFDNVSLTASGNVAPSISGSASANRPITLNSVAPIIGGVASRESSPDIAQKKAEILAAASRMIRDHPESAPQVMRQLEQAGIVAPAAGAPTSPNRAPTVVTRPSNPIQQPLAMNTTPAARGIPYTAAGLPSQAESDRRMEDYRETTRAKAFSAMPARTAPTVPTRSSADFRGSKPAPNLPVNLNNGLGSQYPQVKEPPAAHTLPEWGEGINRLFGGAANPTVEKISFKPNSYTASEPVKTSSYYRSLTAPTVQGVNPRQVQSVRVPYTTPATALQSAAAQAASHLARQPLMTGTAAHAGKMKDDYVGPLRTAPTVQGITPRRVPTTTFRVSGSPATSSVALTLQSMTAMSEMAINPRRVPTTSFRSLQPTVAPVAPYNPQANKANVVGILEQMRDQKSMKPVPDSARDLFGQFISQNIPKVEDRRAFLQAPAKYYDNFSAPQQKLLGDILNSRITTYPKVNAFVASQAPVVNTQANVWNGWNGVNGGNGWNGGNGSNGNYGNNRTGFTNNSTTGGSNINQGIGGAIRNR